MSTTINPNPNNPNQQQIQQLQIQNDMNQLAMHPQHINVQNES